jgi:hypothetical protein
MTKFKLNQCSMCQSQDSLTPNFNQVNGKIYFLCNDCQSLHDSLVYELNKAETLINNVIERGLRNGEERYL